jgi:hypothetical protein
MKKMSLLFIGVAASVCAALVFSGCESPADGAAGNSGVNGPGTFTDGDIDAAALEAVYEYTDTVVLTSGVTSVAGLIPAGKTLIVAGDISVGTAVTDTLEVEGTLEIVLGAALDASGLTSAGTLKGAGSVTGDGSVGLPYYVDAEDVPEGGITYLSGNVTTAGKYAASYAAAGDSLAAVDKDSATTILGLEGITALTVSDVAAVQDITIPAGKTLTLTGKNNTITAAFDLSADTSGSLVVALGAELAVSGGALKGSITNNGTITTSETTAANVISYITVPKGDGTVKLSDTVDLSTITTAAALTQNVEMQAAKC